MKIAMTGVSGDMGREALKAVLALPVGACVRVLLTPKKRNDELARRLRQQYGPRVEVVRGDVTRKEDCERLVAGSEYVLHMAGVIPPASDHSPSLSHRVNFGGTAAMADAVRASVPQPAFIYISSVAVYGNRTMAHPFGRVGDPLLPSPFEAYELHKLKAERYILDANLEKFVILREAAMLHPRMLENNMRDALMFHVVLNSPLEWVSARDTAQLFANIFLRESRGEIDGFWNNVYNIGAGERGRDTGYDTLTDGFAVIGGRPERYFRPDWFPTRNFHGLWFSDADELEELFHFQRDGVHEYWQEIARSHPLFSLGKAVPPELIYEFLFKKLLAQEGSPARWIQEGDRARIAAYFGGEEGVKKLPKRWEDVTLACKQPGFEALKRGEDAPLLSHGFDDKKPMQEWDIGDAKSAAKFRGGECLSEEMPSLTAPLKWRCAEGHKFEASALTVLRAGHWCPHCCYPRPWKFDLLAKRNPYFAQVWYDSHERGEELVYDLEDGTPAVYKMTQGGAK